MSAIIEPAGDIRIGCAGWSIPKVDGASFAGAGTHLERYARRLTCVEINSSFYRSHRLATYARWADSVPPTFRFAVKIPRSITHQARLVNADGPLHAFLAEIAALGRKLGCILIQLPPSLSFNPGHVRRFLIALRSRYSGAALIEPRHATWFNARVDGILLEYGTGRVAADPSLVERAAHPAGDRRVIYFRLHGSPKMYYSSYTDGYLRDLVQRLCAARETGAQVWCIFDNTALGAAMPNALRTICWVREACAGQFV